MAITGVTTFLWFDENALEAAEFYIGLFPDSTLGKIDHYPEGDEHQPPGTNVLSVAFTIFGQPFAGINGGPLFTHSEAVSFMVECDTQEEIDRLWNALTADGGSESQCGWCKDRFGVSWQIVPRALPDLLARGAWSALMQMQRIDIAALEAAASTP